MKTLGSVLFVFAALSLMADADAEVPAPADAPVPVDMLVEVVNEAGEPLDAELDVFPWQCGLSVEQLETGRFSVRGDYRVPKDVKLGTPFSLETLADGYRARVLECGRDFQADDKSLTITLKEGPFRPTELVSLKVLGRSIPMDERWSIPHINRVEYRIEEYLYRAAIGRVPPAEMPRSPYSRSFRFGLQPPPAKPTGAAIREVMAQSLEGAAGLPEVKVVDAEGSPITQISVQWAWLRDPEEGARAPIPTPYSDSVIRTLSSEEGIFTVPNNCMIWSEGTERVFMPAPRSGDPQPFAITLAPVPGSENGQPATSGRNDGPNLSKQEARALVEQLERSRSGFGEIESLKNYSRAVYKIRESRVQEAAPLIRKFLVEWELKEDHDFRYTDDLAITLADLEGEKVLDFLERIVTDTAVQPAKRRSALVGLCRIGSERSVAVFKRMRDAARALPDAPQEQGSYTHAERIAEAVEMICVWIPGVDPKSRFAFRPMQITASVDADYSKSHIECGSVFERTTMSLKRFGDEWLVVEIGGTLCY